MLYFCIYYHISYDHFPECTRYETQRLIKKGLFNADYLVSIKSGEAFFMKALSDSAQNSIINTKEVYYE